MLRLTSAQICLLNAPVTFPPGAGRRGGIGRSPDVPAIGDKSRMSQIALGHGHIRYGHIRYMFFAGRANWFQAPARYPRGRRTGAGD